MLHYLPDETTKAIRALVRAAKKTTPGALFKLTGDGETTRTDSAEKLLAAMDGGAEEYTLRVYTPSKEYLCAFYILTGEGSDAVADYTANKTADAVFNEYLNTAGAV